MRYFNIVVLAGGRYIEYTLSCNQFPSRKDIITSLIDKYSNSYDLSRPVIVNIFEFKNEEDYSNFVS